MKIEISDGVRNVGIDKAVVIRASNLIAGDSPSGLVDRIDETMSFIKNGEVENSKYHDSYRSVLENIGHFGTTPAGEKLCDHFLRKGFKYINNIVDAYNEVSLKFGIGIGGHCVSKIANFTKISIELNDRERQLTPLFSSKPKSVNVGDLIYHNNGDVMAWIGKKDVDSDKYRITEDTNEAVFVILSHRSQNKKDLNLITNRLVDNLSLLGQAIKIQISVSE